MVAVDRNLALLADCEGLAVNAGQATTDQGTATSRVQALQAEVLDQNQQLGVVIKAVWRL